MTDPDAGSDGERDRSPFTQAEESRSPARSSARDDDRRPPDRGSWSDAPPPGEAGNQGQDGPSRRTVLGLVGTVVGSLAALGVASGVLFDDVAQAGPAEPTATFEFDLDESDGRLEVRMTSGDTLNEDNSGAVLYGTREGPKKQWAFPVSAGDVARITGVEPGDTAVVVRADLDGE